MDPIENWCARHRKLIALTIVAISLLFRTIYFTEIISGPCLNQHEWTESDMNFFHKWAITISQERWLVDKPFHPDHGWMKIMSNSYFNLYPEQKTLLIDSLQSAGDMSVDPGVALWNIWLDGKRYYQEPFYPYLIAVFYKIFSPNVIVIFILQLIIGSLTNLLLYFISRKYFNDLTAVVAAFLAIFCGPLLFYEMTLLRATLISFAGLLLVFVFDRAMEKRGWHWWTLLGITLGVAIVLKGIFLLFVAGCFLIMAFTFKTSIKALLNYLSLTSAGILLAISPFITRNVLIGVNPLALTGGGGSMAFINSNNKYYIPGSGVNMSFEYTPKIMAKTHGKLLPVMVETIKTHDSAGSYLNLLWERFSVLFNWYEIPNNTNFYFYRLYAKILKLTFVTFLIIAPLSIIGLALSLFLPRKPCSLYLLVMVHFIPLLVFVVLSRYRLPFLVSLIPFAGFAIVEFLRMSLNKSKAVIWWLPALILLVFWTSRKTETNQTPIRRADYEVAYLYYYKDKIQSLVDKNDFVAAANIMEKFLRHEPQLLDKKEQPGKRSYQEYQLAQFFAEMHSLSSTFYGNSGNPQKAEEELKLANRLRNISVKE